MKLRAFSRLLGVVMTISLVLSGCQTTSFYVSKHLARPDPGIRVLLMPTDIELSELNAGGTPEPNAEWTAKAKKLVTAILNDKMSQLGAKFAFYELNESDFQIESNLVQLRKLHGAVGNAILVHKYVPIFELPSKKEQFDWTLGPKVKVLRNKYNADYALFLYIRDSYTSSGRAVAIFLAAALLGVGLQGGTQIGFASLVDLDSGDIVWFNRLARGFGDLRERKPAEETVSVLLTDFPK
ncbi:MAG: hypothetical protein JKY68_04870 [Rhodospirillales bacterium]|nr:hypothetical protein [Rhodospirillales bacterium]